MTCGPWGYCWLMWALQRKSHLCIPFLGIARPQSQFPHSCDSYSYSYFPAAELADRLWEYINPSQTPECGKWNSGRAIPFLEIFISNFRYCVFVVGIWEESLKMVTAHT